MNNEFDKILHYIFVTATRDGFIVDRYKCDACVVNDMVLYKNLIGIECAISTGTLDHYNRGPFGESTPSLTVYTLDEDKIDGYLREMKKRLIETLKARRDLADNILKAVEEE